MAFRTSLRIKLYTGLALLLCLGWVGLPAVAPLYAQQDDDAVEAADDAAAEAAAAEALGNVAPEQPAEGPAPAVNEVNTFAPPEVNLFSLIWKSVWLMIPIVAMLALSITLTIERFLALRRDKVLPHGLVRQFGDLSNAPGGFDPRKAYRACQQFPCAASNVIRAMLLKIGRPHTEVEYAVREASEREAAKLYSHVRWLNLAAAVTPLMGLFGTVWGMIYAFNATVNLPEGESKADALGDGIVTALVTTLGGLAVAIPAAIMAHYFEGRIQNMFRQIDELLFNLLPQVERYEGKLRVSREVLGEMAGEGGKSSGASKPSAKQTGSRPASEEPVTAEAKS